MADLPSTQPRWGDNGAAITEPSEPQKDVGWDTTYLYRQYLNWWMNLVYTWILWFAQIIFKFSDFGPDQALPGQGVVPAIGAGLNILANAFSARVFANGYPVGLKTGPTANYTYSTNSDTYWDLGRDGVWDPHPVAAADQTQIFTLPANPDDSVTYTVLINGIECTTAALDSTSTRAELQAALIIAINNAVGAWVTAAVSGVDVIVTSDLVGVSFTYAVGGTNIAVITLGASVSNGATALAANHVRVYVVRTNGVNRTVLTDLRRAKIRFSTGLDFDSVRYGQELLGSDANAAAARQTTPIRPGHGTGYVFVHDFPDNSFGGSIQPGSRLYIREATAQLVAVWGCSWSGTQWVADAGSPVAYTMETIGTSTKTAVTLTASIVGTPFADSVWFSAMTSSNGVSKGLAINGRVLSQAGANEYEATQKGRFRGLPAALAVTPFSMMTDFGSSFEYSSTPTIGDEGSHKATNAKWNDATQRWDRILPGVAAYRLTQHGGGFRFLARSPLLADSWIEAENEASGWLIIAIWDYGVQTKVFGPSAFHLDQRAADSFVSQPDPVETSLTELQKDAGASSNLALVDLGSALPIGAIILTITWNFSGYANPGGADYLRVGAYRTPLTAGANIALRTGVTAYDNIPGTSSGAIASTINESVPNCTNDGAAAMLAWIKSSTGTSFTLRNMVVTYKMGE